ncbi:MAG: PAS domain-containing methyl-accepting chemotaxis protein [Planctomycetes bacterium]|nr:PAS domain-containing methyl-accepting chemotaxis protein [Planctomycetota bacterium]
MIQWPWSRPKPSKAPAPDNPEPHSELLAKLAAAREQLRALDAIRACQAVIEFTPDGVIRAANPIMLKTLGYSAKELIGEHHSMLMEPFLRDSEGYRAFWRKLAAGEFQSGVFRRLAKGQRPIWLQASYNPVHDEHGNVTGVVKVAADITARKRREAEALNRSQAYIEFTPDGTIVDANENFLRCMGYSLDEIRGKHHRMFVDSEHAQSPEYATFWRELGQGTFQQNDFRRVARGGRPIWIRGTYSPVLDDAGNVTGVVKIASDVTHEMQIREDTARVTATLSSGLQELNQSATQISRRIADNAALARGATEHMEGASRLIAVLDESSKNVGAISETIREIADKTNLLALNATIEAARAGESGRGFAVVANEVKDLANQTREATSEISSRIEGIQQQVQSAVAAFDSIRRELDGVSTNTTDIASVVEEQSAVVQELDQASRGLAARA